MYNKGYGGNSGRPKGTVSQKEKQEAEAALRSLKMKMANAKKSNVSSQGARPKPNNNMGNVNKPGNYGMGGGYGGMGGGMGGYGGMGGGMGGYGGMDEYDDYNYQPKSNPGYGQPSKPAGTRQPAPKSNANKKPMGNNNNKMGGGLRAKPMGGMGGFGGMGGGMGGGVDDRPIGGGLTAASMPSENEPTTPCPHCGRNFNADAYPKHVKICQKVFQKKRKAFNMQKQRMVDSEQASLMKQGQREAKANPKLNNKAKGGIPKWKLQSMEFRSICNPGNAAKIRKEMGFGNMNMGRGGGGRGGRGGKSGGMGGMGGGMGMGGMDMGGYMPSAIPSDYTHCKYCNRNYNEEAYNKHLNGCKRRYEEAQMRNKIAKKPTGNKGATMRGGTSAKGATGRGGAIRGSATMRGNAGRGGRPRK